MCHVENLELLYPLDEFKVSTLPAVLVRVDKRNKTDRI